MATRRFNYKDDWVSTCALNEVLRQGCRFIDFEIYSINHEPVVATSTTTDYYTKETWNSIPFKTVTNLIKNNAFSSDFVPNNTDPLLIHFRFKSNDILMYNKLADIVKTDLDRFTLDNKYNRQEFLDNMRKKGIDCRQMINPINRALHFKKKFSDSEFPNSINLSNQSVHLPSGLALTNKDINKISSTTKSLLN